MNEYPLTGHGLGFDLYSNSYTDLTPGDCDAHFNLQSRVAQLFTSKQNT
jgi:hypothetical protein